jgi:pentatricopeptide repeat protein
MQVLAIHPHFLIRNEVLKQLRAKWFTLTRDGWHDVVIGLLRDRQVEMALDYLDHMYKEDVEIYPWLYDIMIFNFCDTGDFDEVLKLMQRRLSKDRHLSPATLWYYILDTASQNYHLEATRIAWRHQVGTEQLHPPSGMCINVINTAARHGDFHLANNVLRVLRQRNETLQIYHYEALLESYINAGELRVALSVLPTMIAAKCPPTEATVRPLFLYLQTDPTLPGRALHTLQQLNKADKIIPTVTINAIIEAGVALNDLPFSVQTYKLLHTLSPTGPTTATFNALFRGCSKAGRKDTAMFLASEMLALKVAPDALTYDRLILVCIDAKPEVNKKQDTRGDIDDAFRYLEEMKGKGWWPRRGTCVALVKVCVERGDERVFGFVEAMEEMGMEVAGVQKWVEENWSRR